MGASKGGTLTLTYSLDAARAMATIAGKFDMGPVRREIRNAQPPGRILWSVAEVADVLDWNVRRVRRWLLREQACNKHGRHYYTSKAQLRRVFREAADEVIAQLPE